MKNYEKLVIIPCHLDNEGKVVLDNWTPPPYGYHHVMGIYGDGSGWLMATIDSTVSAEGLVEIATIMASGKPVETDPDYYRKRSEERNPLDRFRFVD